MIVSGKTQGPAWFLLNNSMIDLTVTICNDFRLKKIIFFIKFVLVHVVAEKFEDKLTNAYKFEDEIAYSLI